MSVKQKFVLFSFVLPFSVVLLMGFACKIFGGNVSGMIISGAVLICFLLSQAIHLSVG